MLADLFTAHTCQAHAKKKKAIKQTGKFKFLFQGQFLGLILRSPIPVIPDADQTVVIPAGILAVLKERGGNGKTKAEGYNSTSKQWWGVCGGEIITKICALLKAT